MRKQASSSSLVTLLFHSCFILRLRESCNRKDLTIVSHFIQIGVWDGEDGDEEDEMC
jgi:hypothetical protein